jgi:hypothetical protein
MPMGSGDIKINGPAEHLKVSKYKPCNREEQGSRPEQKVGEDWRFRIRD